VDSFGLLDPGLPELFAAFPEGMRELGYVESQNVSYVRFSAEGRPEKIPQLASELIARNPDVIVTAGPLPVRAVKPKATGTLARHAPGLAAGYFACRCG
jgi:ABC-type uncharacterized transport system substrate-binding protein